MSTSKQRSLFTDPDAAPWEYDDESHRLVATVVFAEGADGQFDYLVPDTLRGHVEAGRRVVVPLGRSNRRVTGYCVAVGNSTDSPARLKEILEVLDDVTLLSPSMLRLTRWMADYYLCSWGAAIETVIPAGVRSAAGTREAVFLSLTATTRERARGMKLGEAQRRALEYLESARQPMTAQQLAKAVNCSLGPIQQLRRRGLVEETTQRVVWGRVSQQPVEVEQGWHPNAAQQRALDGIRAALQANEFRTFVIHGVTGSGKTEVYIRAIEEVVRSGRQAIVLVPEISLTPQTEQRFRSRFPSVAVLHSHQSPVERHWHWRRIARGEVQVVVGARSAVFAPTPHLGLIVIDEEHDASFKQDSTPRYHAREVARQRCLMQRVPLVLGSATPSLESYQAALRGEATLLPLPHRVLDRPLPHVATIDLRSEFQNRKQRGAISRPLHQAIHQALIDGGQVILLLNRRGYSPIIQCPSCGQAVKCPYCDITLTHHRTGALAVCHYCDYQQATPTHCPNCQSTGIRYVGLGTQRLEAEVRARFPHYECLRMDSDSMQQHGSHEKALARFRQGEVRILLGTQMIAKGLDFPNVTLVGVINADIALHLPNFRAAERTFQLVTQVAGRTGRGEKGGRVLVQTFTPEHPAIIAATRHDFVQFAEGELPCRERFGYPPFGAMVRIIVRGDAVEPVSAWADHLGAALTAELEGQPVRVMGPAPAPIAKLRGKHRYHLLLLGPDGEPLRAAVRDVMQRVKTPDDVQWIADVDPLDML